MKKLLSSEDSGVGLSGCSDPVVEMAMTAFTSLMLLATQIDSKNKEEQKAAISEAMDSRRIDLKALLPGMKNCDLTVGGKRASCPAGGQRQRSGITGTGLCRVKPPVGDAERQFSFGGSQTAACDRRAEHGHPLGGGVAEL